MRKYIFFILTIVLATTARAQQESIISKKVTNEFQKKYNANDYEGIFNMFAKEMKDFLPHDKTLTFLNTLNAQAGKIIERTFIKYSQGNVALYKTKFERALVALYISVDANSKINGLMVKPFVEESNTKNVVNNLSDKNDFITDKQFEIIFNNSKNFPNQTQISIAFIKDGEVNYFGIHKIKDSISTIQNHNSVFEIGSISKVFTATLLANFVVNGKVKLNENINKYLKTSFNNNTEISFIGLANHTSGLPRLPSNTDFTKVNPQNPYKDYKDYKLKQYLSSYLELSNKGAYQYSNLGAGLLAYTLGVIENETYDNLLKKKIFSKYNMRNSTAEIHKVKGNLVKGLNNEGKEVLNWQFSSLVGAGAIYSTVEDLSHFAISQFDESNKELNLTRNKTFEINDNIDIGLGWHILKSKSKNLWYWHNGGTGGYSSSMAIDKNLKNGIIILSNVSAFNPNMGNIDKLCFELMKTIDKE